MRRGSGYLGTEQWEITPNDDYEIIPDKPEGWTLGYNLYKFSYNNPDADSTVVINGKHTLLIPKGRGFNMGSEDTPITSFVVKEQGTRFSFIAAY